MAAQFNYKTIDIELNKETASLGVILKSNISTELVFELESLFAWTSNKLEIASIYIKSNQDEFLPYFDSKELHSYDSDKMNNFVTSFRKLIMGMLYLPQTVICDIGSKCSALGSELILGADIRVSSKNANVSWNHLQLGLAPVCGGIGFLEALIGSNKAKHWILLNKTISGNNLFSEGLIHEVCEEQAELDELLLTIKEQSPVSRIQTKRAFLETISEKINYALEIETKIASASLMTNDFKKEKNKFISARNFSRLFSAQKEAAEA